MNNLLILEDKAGTMEWLVSICSEAIPGASIIKANTLMAARELSQHPIDLAVVDLNLPDGSGVDFIIWLLAKYPNAYVVVATICDDDDHLFKALQAGALGYLLKEETKESLVAALKGVLNGQPPLSPAISLKIIQQFRATSDSSKKQKTHTSILTKPKRAEQQLGLTAREEQVINLVAKGFNRREVASYLSISSHTVASHVKNIYRKLNVSSRAEVALEAKRLGLA